jgi:phage recombination protein Bet
MTTKQIEFTQEQKSLIWNTKLVQAGATEVEAKAFFEVCETYGLNPLEGDIVFQKYESSRGPVVSYIVTRDGYQKYAMRDPNFQNMLSGVVREGDHFEVDAVQGLPIHKFAAQRGKIIGAWAVVKHKTRGNILVYVDFQEYYNAFNGKSPVWKSLPSSMIEKVAQSTALRRTFPLGVHFRSEDEVIEDIQNHVDTTSAEVPKQETQQESLVDELKAARAAKESKKEKKEKAEAAKAEKKEAAKKEKPAKQEETAQIPVQKALPVDETPQPQSEPVQTEEQSVPAQEAVQSTPVQETEKKESNAVIRPEKPVLEYIRGELGTSGNGTIFLKIHYKENGQEKIAFARGEEKIALFDEFEDNAGHKFVADIQDINGFSFILSAFILPAEAV